jgi:hypothetical protein
MDSGIYFIFWDETSRRVKELTAPSAELLIWSSKLLHATYPSHLAATVNLPVRPKDLAISNFPRVS